MLNKKVYINDLEQFGIVKDILEDGTISKVQIITPTGNKTIDTINMVITIVKIVEELKPLWTRIVQGVKGWFGK